jgi:hypothetical protein
MVESSANHGAGNWQPCSRIVYCSLRHVEGERGREMGTHELSEFRNKIYVNFT